MRSLDVNEIAALLNAETTTGVDNAPQQTGPLRHHENAKPCARRGCTVPTFYTLFSIRTCTIHALREMNELLYELGYDKAGKGVKS